MWWRRSVWILIVLALVLSIIVPKIAQFLFLKGLLGTRGTIGWGELVVHYLPLAISVLALVVSFLNLLLQQRKYAELQAEKTRRRFDISVDETIKQDLPPREPCSMWAVRFLVANRSNESILLDELLVELSFRQIHPTTKEFLLGLLWPSMQQVSGIRFRFAEPTLDFFTTRITPMPMKYMPHFLFWAHQFTHLVNRETREPIRFAPRHWHCGPEPGRKETWMLFGRLPAEIREYLAEQKLYLATIKCHFYTDQGVVTVSGSFALSQNASDTFIAELDQLAASIAAGAVTDITTTD